MGWRPFSPVGIAMCHACGVDTQADGEGIRGRGAAIGVDPARTVFEGHGAAADWSVLLRKTLSRPQVARVMAEQPPCGDGGLPERASPRAGDVAAGP